MRKIICVLGLLLAFSFGALAAVAETATPRKLTDDELSLVQGGELAICCDECHLHGTILHCTGCFFCIIGEI